MPEVPVSSLDTRLQKQIDNARVALERGNFDYTIEICGQILRAAPGVLPVRKLMRTAQRKKFDSKNRLFAKTAAGFSSAPFMLSTGLAKKDPAKGLEAAEKMLTSDPTNVAANRLLAECAAALQLPETAAFAFEAVAEASPGNRDIQLQLGEYLLGAGRHKDAVRLAEEILKKSPIDGDGQNLLRKASIAQTVTTGNWETTGTFRDKLKDEKTANSLEQAAKVVTSAEMTERLVEEAVKRVAAEPQNLNHYRSVIQGLRTLNRPAEALEWVRRARQLPSGATDNILEKSEAELLLLILEGRAKELEAAAAAAPGDVALADQAEAARAELLSSQLQQAEGYAERYPNDYEGQFRLAGLYLKAGELDKAAAKFQVAQRGPKVRLPALAGLGKCFRAKKLYDLAAQQFRAAKAEMPSMDDTKKDVIYDLATSLELMGKAEEAIHEFKLIYAEDIGYRDVSDKINAYYSAR